MTGPDLHVRVAPVTGATDGIGRVTARVLAERGATVLVVGRNLAKTEATAAEIRRAAGHNEVHSLLADLSVQAEVRALAAQVSQRWPKLHILVNNAGAVFAGRRETTDGIERTWALNHLAYFLLTDLLLPALRAGSEPGCTARIVNVASRAHKRVRGIRWDDVEHRRWYFGPLAYGQSKLANVLFTYALARRLAAAGQGVTANVLHPGVVRTNMGRNNRAPWWWLGYTVFGWFGISPERGADTVIYLAAAPEVEGVSGQYFVERRAVPSSAASRDADAAERLWVMSARMTKHGDSSASGASRDFGRSPAPESPESPSSVS
jgi:NAD(P)-dependent dehydrogenase (short-subunit alcohol dehydrogenase family)